MKSWLAWVLMAPLLLLWGGLAAAGTRDVSPKEAAALIEANRGKAGFVVLDLRTPSEFAQERIDGAVLVDFLAPSFRQELSKLDPKSTYLVYCRTGNRSRQALPAFEELGFQHVVHLSTGIVGWKEAGLPTVR